MQYSIGKSCKTLSEAVDQLMGSLDRGDLDQISKMAESDLVFLHFGLGQYIREHFGLWQSNKELLSACDPEGMHPDDASAAIIHNLWTRLQTKH